MELKPETASKHLLNCVECITNVMFEANIIKTAPCEKRVLIAARKIKWEYNF